MSKIITKRYTTMSMISINEASKVIGCSKVTVQNWIGDGAPLGAVKKMNKLHKMAWLVDRSKIFAYAHLRGWEFSEGV